MGSLTDFIFSLNDKDYIFFIIAIISAGTFVIVSNDKIYKIYSGIIIGFLLFQIANLEIKNLLLTQSGLILDTYQNFLLTNKDFVLSFFTCMIPVFGFSFVLSNSFSLNIRSSGGENLIFGFLFPFFFLGIFISIFKNSAFELVFLRDILSPFSSSFIYDILSKNLHYVSIFLLFFIFYRLLITFVMAFFGFVIHFFGVKVLKKFGGGGGHEEEEEKEESHSHTEEHHHG